MWDPKQYNKFSLERHRPAIDLMTQIPDNGYDSIIDLGCGDGFITNILHDRFNPQAIVGLDSSSSMLAKAKDTYAQIDWELGSIANFSGEYDLIFSNAALQWLDNHEELFRQIGSQAKKTLAIQIPNSINAPFYVALNETVAANPVFSSKLATAMRINPGFEMDKYYKILNRSFKSIDIWETSYLHQLPVENAVLEWLRGTALVPVKEKLSQSEYQEFEAIYNSKLLKAYPPLDNGITLFPFKRMFMVAKK